MALSRLHTKWINENTCSTFDRQHQGKIVKPHIYSGVGTFNVHYLSSPPLIPRFPRVVLETGGPTHMQVLPSSLKYEEGAWQNVP
jgi:hypothetical protein